MFWKKWVGKEEVPILYPPKKWHRKTKRNQLTIIFKNQNTRQVWIDDWNKPNYIEPWIPFYRWFFNDERDVFMLKYTNGEVLIRRDNIDSFAVSVKEVEVPINDV